MCNRVTNPWDMGIFSRPVPLQTPPVMMVECSVRPLYRHWGLRTHASLHLAAPGTTRLPTAPVASMEISK